MQLARTFTLVDLLGWHKVVDLPALAQRAILAGYIDVQCRPRPYCYIAKVRRQATHACVHLLCTRVQHGSLVIWAAHDELGMERVRWAMRAWQVLTEADKALARDLGLGRLVRVCWPCAGYSRHPMRPDM